MILRNYRQHYRIENLRKIIEKLSLSKKFTYRPPLSGSDEKSGYCVVSVLSLPDVLILGIFCEQIIDVFKQNLVVFFNLI